MWITWDMQSTRLNNRLNCEKGQYSLISAKYVAGETDEREGPQPRGSVLEIRGTMTHVQSNTYNIDDVIATICQEM